MAIRTSVHGQMKYEGSVIAKCRQFTIEISREKLRTTPVSDLDESYAPGRRAISGTGTILYDSTDATTKKLLNSIFSDLEAACEFVLSAPDNSRLECSAFLTDVSTPVSVGEITACSISIQGSGTIAGGF